MAFTIHADNSNIITLEEYLEYASSLDVLDRDEVLNSAWKLKELSNNKDFLVKKFNKELSDWKSFQSNNSYSSQTLTLGGGDKYFVRANMWFPRSKSEVIWELENKLFAYSLPHDHNFSFLTVGYWGSGYKTKIYEYDSKKVIGYVGEKVDIEYLEDTVLNEGKVMFYRACTDIHTQEEPVDFSISLNLLIASPELSTYNQYWFDLEKGCIKNYVQNSATSRMMICKMARYISNGQTANLLEDIALHHHFPRVRAEAYKSLAAIETNCSENVWNLAMHDKNNYVKFIANQQINQLSQVPH